MVVITAVTAFNQPRVELKRIWLPLWTRRFKTFNQPRVELKQLVRPAVQE